MWKPRKTLLCIIVLTISLALAFPVQAVNWHFPVTIDIADGMTYHFGNAWFSTSGASAHITKWFVDNWLNYTVDNVGTQEIYNGSQPHMVVIDGVNRTVGDGWTYGSGIATVSSAQISANVYYGAISLDFSPSDIFQSTSLLTSMGKGLGFASSGLLQVSGIVDPFNIERLFSSSNTLSLSKLLSGGTENAFTTFGTFLLSSLATFMQERLFTSTNILTVSGLTGYGKERLFASANTLTVSGINYGVWIVDLRWIIDPRWVFPSVSPSIAGYGIELGFSKGVTTLISALTSWNLESLQQLYASAGLINVLSLNRFGFEKGFSLPNILALSGLTGIGKERLFTSSGTVSLISLLTGGIERGFLQSAIIQVSSILTKATENAFRNTGTVTLSSLTSAGIETLAQAFASTQTGTTLSTATASIRNENAFRLTGTTSLLSMLTNALERGFTTSATLNLPSLITYGKEKGFTLTGQLPILGIVGKAVENAFSRTGTLTVSSLPSSSVELLSYGNFFYAVSSIIQIGHSISAVLPVSLPVVVTNLPLMLGAFGVVIAITALSFVFVRRRREDED